MNNKHKLLNSLGNKPRTGKVVGCIICNNEFYVKPSKIGIIKCCSLKCANKSKERYIILKCKTCGNKYKTYKAQIRIHGSSCCSVKCKGIYFSKKYTGANSHNWQGGKSSLLKRLRSSVAWEKWRESVFKRDNYTCQDCGQYGGYLEPHHLKPFAYFPDLRFEVSNGQTLCKKCHNKTKVGSVLLKKQFGL